MLTTSARSDPPPEGDEAGADDEQGVAAASLATLKQVALSASRARSAEAFLGEAVEPLARLMGSELASILLLEGNHLYHAAAIGLPDEYLEAIDGVEIGPKQGSSGSAAFYGKTVISEDLETDERWDDFRELARAAGLRSCWSVPLRLPNGTVLGTFATYSQVPHRPTPDQVALCEAYSSIVALGLDNVERQAEVAASYEAAVLALTSALDVRDDYTGAHSTATSRLVREVCVQLEMAPQEIETASRVAALHDVGKLGVPTEILTLAGPLSAAQSRLVRDHPVIGEQILRQIPGMDEVSRAVRHEHERWDGAGYPDGLSGVRIPLVSRIVFACDAYHAMVSDRPYRTSLEQAEAIRELTENSGSQFDPQVIAALLEVLGNETAMLGCSPVEVGERHRREAIERMAAEIGAEDVFVFRRVAADTYSHLAGAGRGDGWAGNIELHSGDSPFLPALAQGQTQFLTDPEPIRIVGPYYACSAVVVPCGHDVIVVFGSSTDSLKGAAEREVSQVADRIAQMIDHVATAKRLADELEVLDAVRAVTTVNASGVQACLAEVSERAALALSCEFGAVVVDREVPNPRIGWFEAGWMPSGDIAATREILAGLAARLRQSGQRAMLVQDSSTADETALEGLGRGDGVASLHAVAIGELAVLVTVHAWPSPRGFTNLCQRVARSLGDGAELVIRRALAQERLAHENAQLERRAATDPLTRLNNRGGWDESLVRAQLDLSRGQSEFALALFDVDGLKRINTEFGHPAGDDLLRAFARALGETARANDFVARIGGDEFAVLLRDCDIAGADAWCARLVDRLSIFNAENTSDNGFAIEASWGCASTASHGSVAEAIAEADATLRASKPTAPNWT